MLTRTYPINSPYEIRRTVDQWEVPAKPHCSNCSHAKVGGTPDNPVAECDSVHGKPLSLIQLTRQKHARQFKPATSCPDYDDMGPPCNVRQP
jgi:hypothetical protein